MTSKGRTRANLSAMVLLAFLPLVLLFAMECSKWDAEEIAYRLKTGGESLDHAPMWRFRALIVVILSIPAAHLLGNWWTLVPLWGMGAFGFSAAFRYRLNRLRGLDVRYIAPWSNFYDMTMWTLHGGFIPSPLNWEDYRARYFDGETKYTKGLHRAGSIAYATEITITAACIVWALYIQA